MQAHLFSRRRSTVPAAALAAACLMSGASAQFVVDTSVAPPANATTEAPNGGNSIPLGFGGLSDATLQWIFSESELADIPIGSSLTGMQFRRSGGGVTGPAVAVVFPNLRIEIATAKTTPATISTTFANNIMPDNTVVRNSAFTIGANSIPGGATPNNWGPFINFERPFVYRGGPIVITMRYPVTIGSAGAFADVLESGNPGFGTSFSAIAGSDENGAIGSTNNVPVTRFTFTTPQSKVKHFVAGNYDNNFFNAESGFNNPEILGATANTMQTVFSSKAFSQVPVGTAIMGVTWRLNQNSASTFPAGDQIAFNSFSIELAEAVLPPDQMSATVANNELAADKVLVRSGPLRLPANAFVFAGPNNAFGVSIRFDKPYIYRGGDVVMTIRHSGNLTGENQVDSITTQSSVGSFFTTRRGATENATETTSVFTTPITRFDIDPALIIPPASATELEFQNLGSFFTTDGTYQWLIDEELLRGVRVGAAINGLSLRINQSLPAFPASAFSTPDLRISVASAATTASTMSSTFAANVGPDEVQVKSGSYVFQPLSFPGGRVNLPNDFGAPITFDRPFIYRGGPLVVTMRMAATTASPAVAIDADTPSSSTGTARRRAGGLAPAVSTSSIGPSLRLHFENAVTGPNAAPEYTYPGGWSLNGANTLTQSSARRQQTVMIDKELQSLSPGATISSVAWRQGAVGGAASFLPQGPMSFANYSITLARAATTPGTMSATFANNVGSPSVTARSGALTFPSLSFPPVVGPDTVGRFGRSVELSKSFAYPGGPLLLDITHDGNLGGTPFIFDALPFASGFIGNQIQTIFSAAAGSPTGGLISPNIPRFFFHPPSCVPDLNRDGVVDLTDFSAFVVAFNDLINIDGDFNGDLVTDNTDFVIFVSYYNEFLCP